MGVGERHVLMANIPNRGRRVNSYANRSSNHHVNVTLLALVQADVALVERRGEWWGQCPFHADTTPSFSVNAEKQVFYCFGCGASGDAIEYLRRARGYSYAEAAKAVGRDLIPTDRELRRLTAKKRERELTRYYTWWHGKLRDWNELLDLLRSYEITYRDQCEKLGETMSDASYSFWSTRLGDLYFQQTVMEQLFHLTDAERFAAWREEAGEL
jgi:hypothetical protein